jgi:transcriptional regulator with XRE-family HTH domain
MTSSNRRATADLALEESARLRKLWNDDPAQISQAEFAETYDIGGQSAVANFLHGRSLLSLKAGLGFARGLGVELEQFSPRLAAEARSISDTLNDLGRNALSGSPAGKRLPAPQEPPLLGELRQTQDGKLEQVLYGNQPQGRVSFLTRDDHAYALRIRGDAFHPRYRAGECLILSAAEDKVQGADALVQITLGPLILMQWNWERDGDVQLLPLSEPGRPMTLSSESLSWAHRVLAVVGQDSITKR